MKIASFEIADPIPEISNPRAIAILKPWVDVGNVGTIALNALEKHMESKELGRIERPGTFIDFTRTRPEIRTVEEQRIVITPNTIINYAHYDGTDEDFLFLHLLEPHSMAEDYIDSIVEVLNHFNVRDYCRIGGMYDAVPHTRPLLITGDIDDKYSDDVRNMVSGRGQKYEGPTSIMSNLTQILDEAEIPTSMLMAHLPHYAPVEEDHLGASKLMEVLCAMYDLPNELISSRDDNQQYEAISRLIAGDGDAQRQIRRLETEYDQAIEADRMNSPNINISPGVENFLREMSQRLDRPTNE